MRIAKLTVSLVAATSLLAACGGSGSTSGGEDVSIDLFESDTTETTVEVVEGDDVASVLFLDDSFSILVNLLDTAGLVDALMGEGPITVFAPTDDAFLALGQDMIDTLLLPENADLLTQILTYHVVAANITSSNATDGSVESLEGSSLTISTANGVTVNGAKVVNADLTATNGTVHAIDKVLLPPGVNL
jgi:uncharacterized surface protein with fasciclin (FAS1) repeats